MTDTELPFPAETMTPDDAPAPAPVAAAPRQNVATVDLMSLALSRFGQWRAGAAALVEKYRGVVFDCTTPKGYEQAKKALADVRQPRYAAQNVSKASKSELAAVSKAIGAEEQAVIDYLARTEIAIKDQIDAEDGRRAAAEAEAKRAEAARIARHRAAIEAIEAYVGHASGLPSHRIADGLTALRAIDDGFKVEAWDEFADQARATIAATITSLTTMMAAAKRSEDAAVEAERLRAENVRQAAELAELRAEREAAARREQEAQRLADKQRREAVAAARAESERLEALAVASAPAPPQEAEAVEPVVEPVAAQPASGSIVKLLTLGDVNARLGFRVNANLLRVLGVSAAVDGMYAETQFPTIVSALIAHLGRLT